MPCRLCGVIDVSWPYHDGDDEYMAGTKQLHGRYRTVDFAPITCERALREG